VPFLNLVWCVVVACGKKMLIGNWHPVIVSKCELHAGLMKMFWSENIVAHFQHCC